MSEEVKAGQTSRTGDGGMRNIEAALADPATRLLLRGIVTDKTKVGGYPDTIGIAEDAYALALSTTRPSQPAVAREESGYERGLADGRALIADDHADLVSRRADAENEKWHDDRAALAAGGGR